MAGEVTNAVVSGLGCLGLLAGGAVLLLIGYFAFHIILYLLPCLVAIGLILAAIYGIGYVIYALLTGK